MAFKVKCFDVEESDAWVTFWLLVTFGALCFCGVVWLIVAGLFVPLVKLDGNEYFEAARTVVILYCVGVIVVGGFLLLFAKIIPHGK